MVQVKIINLDSRKDRWLEVLPELSKLGIKNYQRFSALSGGHLGCDKSHRECLKGDGNILILEDDVIFENNAQEVFQKAQDQLPENWDMLYLGANVKLPAERYSENLFRVNKGVHTTHAILWSDKGRKKMNSVWKPGMQFTIDHWLYEEGLSIMECYVCYPMIAFQRGSYSDVRKEWLDYKEEMLENQKKNMV